MMDDALGKETDTPQVAVYECRCGNQVEIREQHFTKLQWAAAKFGFRNNGAFIGHNRECCDRPEYASVGSREIRR